MTRCYAYIRVSTAKQGEKGVSLQEQRAAIERFAAREKIEIVEWFEERESAAKRGRPVFSKILELLRRKKADGLVVHKIDRSARNLKDWADLGELIDDGVGVFFANEGLDLHSRGGRLSADIQAVVAADYIRNLREEARKGFYGRLKQGVLPLPAPLGYLDRGAGKPKAIDPVKGPLVRRAFELYDSGQYSLETLLEELHRLGLRNRRDGRVSKSGLSWLLNNPFYIGLIKIRSTGEIFDGAHEPLITKALYARVQARLKGRFHGKASRHDYLFRKLLTCSHCGLRLTGERQKGHVYYRCHTRDCPTKCVREEAVDQAFRTALGRITFTDREKRYLGRKLETLRGSSAKLEEKKTQILQCREGQLRSRLGRLTDAFVDGVVDKATYEERKADLLMERQGTADELQRLAERPNALSEDLQRLLKLASGALLSYEKATVDERRDLLRNTTSNRLINGRDVSIELRMPLRLIAQREPVLSGAPQRNVLRTRTDVQKSAATSRKEVNPVLDSIFARLVEWVKGDSGDAQASVQTAAKAV